MIRQKFGSSLLALVLAGVAVLGGCESTQRKPTTQARMPTDVPTADAASSRTSSKWPFHGSSSTMAWSSMAYPTGKAATSSIGVEKGFPREVRAGQPFDYEIVVTNLTSEELTNVVVRDEVEALTVTSATPPSQESARGMHAWNIGTLGPKQSKTIRIKATPSGAASAGSCATVEHDFLLCSTVPVVSPKLRLTKTGPAEVLKCDEIEYTFEVTNTGTGSIANVKINDPLPAGLTAAGGGRTITLDAGTLGAGKSKMMKTKVRAERTGRFENRATASGQGGLTASSGTVATVVRQPVLKITKTCATRQFIGRPIEYTITVMNSGDGAARNTVIEDGLPSGTQFISASDGGRSAGGKVTWNVGTLAPNASKKVTMRVSPSGAGVFRNTATARAYCANPVSDTCQTEVTGIPAILLEVVDIEDPDEVGTTETYVVTVTNQGSAEDKNITIVCTIEPNQEYVSSTGPTRATSRGNTISFAPLASLAAKKQAVWKVTVRNVRAGDVRFKTVMTSSMLTRPVEETEATQIYE